MKNKRSSFQYKQRNNNAIFAHRQAMLYAQHWMKLTEKFNDFIGPFGKQIVCPNISREVRAVYRMFSTM